MHSWLFSNWMMMSRIKPQIVIKPTGDFSPDQERPKLGLYIHIPFCLSKCAYCDFYSFVPNNAELMEEYVNAVIMHMREYSDGCKNHDVDTVYIGGGTPTALPPDLLMKLISAIHQNFDVLPI